jgi:general stress protein YciG
MANTSKRGFASMDPSKQREIASKGGRAAHAKGTAHEFTSDEARVAGRKGGEAVSRDRAHMSAIGREGGHSRGRTRSQAGNGGMSGGNGQPMNNGGDNERSNYIGQGSDRGSFASSGSDRGGSQRESGSSSSSSSSRDESFSGRGQL